MVPHVAGTSCLLSDGRLKHSAVCSNKTWKGGVWFRIPDIKDYIKRAIYFNIQRI